MDAAEVAAAQERGVRGVVQGNAARLPVSDGTADAVLAVRPKQD